ncbi:hypothetical protein K470DRAFT_249885 [Piedraia hortae CBS 480.64]|uniref:C2H2-type domain-containing protein n=1 Tax=Piedraia hortae CBS 480.64 TaxID=1314780 RepID=A0A6A7BUU5_9PEZI|nr:hypothetical protein K470DRAFT_249885 [Piedraia hortae CBS 480.64]
MDGDSASRERRELRPEESYRDRHRSSDRRRDRSFRRSRSPGTLDRYEPAHRRDGGYRERRRSSPPAIDRYTPAHNASVPTLVNPMPDPMQLGFQVGFTWFAEWWRMDQRIQEEKARLRTGKPPLRARSEREMREEREAERPMIQAAYDQYKENLQRAQALAFVREHRNESWFRERYIPEIKEQLRAGLRVFRRSLYSQWERDLQAGEFDDFSLEGIYKSEANNAAEDNEVLGIGDLLPSKGADKRDPIASQPALLIKTISPAVRRDTIEAFAKEHLGDGECGFRHLSLSDPHPLKRFHRMGWILLNPRTNAEAGAIESEEKAEDGSAGPADVCEQALANINGKTVDDPEHRSFTVHCGVHRAPDAVRKKALWDLFSAPERITRDLELATRLARSFDNELGDEYFGVAKVEQRIHQLTEAGMLETAPVGATGDGEDDGEVLDEHEQELVVRRKKLDLLVEYLRRVYSFCFFCVFESDSVHELQRKCPGGHLRRPRTALSAAAREVAQASVNGSEFPLRKNGRKDDGTDVDGEAAGEERKLPVSKNIQQLQRAFSWVKTFEEKILQILEPEKANLRRLGGMPLEEGIDEELNKFVKQEDANKYRCKVLECTKLFKGPDFWRKHVEKRHVEFYKNIVETATLVNDYVLDPAHIAPSRNDPNSNGHYPPPNSHGPVGTPRGFQLNPQLAMGLPMGALPNFPGFGTGMNMTWQGLPGFSGVGPMRTLGNRGGAYGGIPRLPGPYGRHDNRGMRTGLGARVEGGAGAVGPREAVVGRQLKSYEDLDADTGNGTGELDY